VRSYLSTARKQNVTSSEALSRLFEGRQPTFMMDAGDNPETF
jgi:transposase